MDSEAVANPPLSRRLGQGPVVLLVGQRYLESHDGFDPFVTAIAKHLGSEQADYGHPPKRRAVGQAITPTVDGATV